MLAAMRHVLHLHGLQYYVQLSRTHDLIMQARHVRREGVSLLLASIVVCFIWVSLVLVSIVVSSIWLSPVLA